MATRETTTYTHTCDLCGETRDEGELTQFQALARTGPNATLTRDVPIGADVCGGCLSRPLSELKAFLEAETERKCLRTVRVSLSR